MDGQLQHPGALLSWPDWIETLKARYLADEASVFLLHGRGVADGRWIVDGQTLDCLTTLNRFLRSSRQILGVVDPELGLSFADPADQNRFRGLVEAERVLSGSTNVLRDEQPREALTMVWRAMSAALPPVQGYVLLFAEAFSGNMKKGMRELPEGVPSLSRWPSDPVVREGDKVVVMLAEALDGVHPELVAALGAGLVEVDGHRPPVPVTDEVTDLPELYDLPPAVEPSPPAEAGALEAAFEAAFAEALASSVPQGDAMPVRQALAVVAGQHGRFEGVADGEGFAHWYASDVVLRAAAEQLMTAAQGSRELSEVLHENAQVRVLVRRLTRLLESS